MYNKNGDECSSYIKGQWIYVPGLYIKMCIKTHR